MITAVSIEDQLDGLPKSLTRGKLTAFLIMFPDVEHNDWVVAYENAINHLTIAVEIAPTLGEALEQMTECLDRMGLR